MKIKTTEELEQEQMEQQAIAAIQGAGASPALRMARETMNEIVGDFSLITDETSNRLGLI